MAIKLEYDFLKLPAYKDYELWENEFYFYLKKKGVPIDVYVRGDGIGETFFEKKVKMLEREEKK
jgi:hypothetical protein